MKSITTYDGKEFIYDENIWTGKKTITVDGEKLEKDGKKSFKLGEIRYKVKGNFLTGVKLMNDTETYVLVRSLTVVEFLLSFLPCILVFFGGAIGGAIGALAGIITSTVVRKINNVFLKILASVGIASLAFLIWFVIVVIVATVFAA